MIIMTKLERIVDENRTMPCDVGGELETFVGRAVQQFVLQNFGIITELQIKKE